MISVCANNPPELQLENRLVSRVRRMPALKGKPYLRRSGLQSADNLGGTTDSTLFVLMILGRMAFFIVRAERQTQSHF